jgi:hypothetical protein
MKLESKLVSSKPKLGFLNFLKNGLELGANQ